MQLVGCFTAGSCRVIFFILSSYPGPYQAINRYRSGSQSHRWLLSALTGLLTELLSVLQSHKPSYPSYLSYHPSF